jgi:hypothetical protein
MNTIRINSAAQLRILSTLTPFIATEYQVSGKTLSCENFDLLAENLSIFTPVNPRSISSLVKLLGGATPAPAAPLAAIAAIPEIPSEIAPVAPSAAVAQPTEGLAELSAEFLAWATELFGNVPATIFPNFEANALAPWFSSEVRKAQYLDIELLSIDDIREEMRLAKAWFATQNILSFCRSYNHEISEKKLSHASYPSVVFTDLVNKAGVEISDLFSRADGLFTTLVWEGKPDSFEDDFYKFFGKSAQNTTVSEPQAAPAPVAPTSNELCDAATAAPARKSTKNWGRNEAKVEQPRVRRDWWAIKPTYTLTFISKRTHNEQVVPDTTDFDYSDL